MSRAINNVKTRGTWRAKRLNGNTNMLLLKASWTAFQSLRLKVSRESCKVFREWSRVIKKSKWRATQEQRRPLGRMEFRGLPCQTDSVRRCIHTVVNTYDRQYISRKIMSHRIRYYKYGLMVGHPLDDPRVLLPDHLKQTGTSVSQHPIR